MISRIKNKFNTFINGDKDYPLLVGFISGFYPFVFYYSNNFEMINSWQHFLFLSFLFLILPVVFVFATFKVFQSIKVLNPYTKHLLFVVIIELTAIFLCFVYYQGFRIKLLAVLLVLTVFLSLKVYREYKKLVVFVGLLAVIPFVSLSTIFINRLNPNRLSWMKQNDAIETTQFKSKPNIYFIEPDGYAGQEIMAQKPYLHNNKMYGWFSDNGFKVYDCNSNYPASLASNASIFAMKHHYLKNIPKSPFEMEDAREIIVGNNPVISILKNNNYKTFYIAEDEYFQQNFEERKYDYYNIDNDEIPLFSDGGFVWKDVFLDLKKCVLSEKNNHQPKFYFVEKMLPHHINFDGTGVENERKVYLNKMEEVNLWLKEVVAFIEKNDPNSIIIISADHGGWVGIENYNEMFTTKDKKLMKSIFNNLLAIKWNDTKYVDYDEGLKSNVNIFRILFSYLSEDKTLLKHLEADSSYTIRQENSFTRKGVKAEY